MNIYGFDIFIKVAQSLGLKYSWKQDKIIYT